MPVELSKSSDYVICILYREYLRRVKRGDSLSLAMYFGDSDSVQKSLLPSWTPENVATVCAWLISKGLMDGICCGDGSFLDLRLTEDGIIYMEGRFSNRLDKLREWLETVGTLLPF